MPAYVERNAYAVPGTVETARQRGIVQVRTSACAVLPNPLGASVRIGASVADCAGAEIEHTTKLLP